MKFFPYDAVEIPRQEKSGLIDREPQSLRAFWDRVNGQFEEELSEGIGCYIFSIRTGGGTKPWYVGLAEKQPFRKECFTSHKLVLYNDILGGQNGTPQLTLVANKTPGGKLKSASGSEHPEIEFLEKMLWILMPPSPSIASPQK